MSTWLWVIPMGLYLCLLVIEVRVTQKQRRMLQEQSRRIEDLERFNGWLEEREVFFEKMVLAAKYAMASRIPPDSFGQFFVNGMISKEGVAAAHHLYEQHKAMIVVHREVTQEIRDAYEALARWEQTHPLPLRVVVEVTEDQAAIAAHGSS